MIDYKSEFTLLIRPIGELHNKWARDTQKIIAKFNNKTMSSIELSVYLEELEKHLDSFVPLFLFSQNIQEAHNRNLDVLKIVTEIVQKSLKDAVNKGNK